MDRKRVHSVHVLRGIASLAVAWFHLTCGNPAFLPEGMLKLSGQYGWIGIEVFFVISGFIIPYSLHSGGYTIGKYPLFMLKRIKRLYPPYLLSIVIILLFNYISSLMPFYGGSGFSIDPYSLLLHVFYLNDFAGIPWANVVFWSLAIELQFYLLIGLVFPALCSGRAWLVASFIVLGIAGILIHAALFKWIFLFLMGIAVFTYLRGLAGLYLYIFLLSVSFLGTLLTLGILEASVGLVTCLVIIGLRYTNGVLDFLGDISYSLFLIHSPLGGRIINLSVIIDERMPLPFTFKLATLGIALGLSVVSGWILYKFVERPSMRASARLRYR